MAYTNEFTSADLSTLTIDGLVTFGVALAGFATIIGLIFVYKLIKKNKP